MLINARLSNTETKPLKITIFMGCVDHAQMVLCLPHLIPTGTPPISRLAHGNAQRDA